MHVQLLLSSHGLYLATLLFRLKNPVFYLANGRSANLRILTMTSIVCIIIKLQGNFADNGSDKTLCGSVEHDEYCANILVKFLFHCSLPWFSPRAIYL